MSYTFGPVPSRRLGRSLGVDVVPFKTCTYDCVYCQLGRTTCRTDERKEYVPLDDMLAAVRMKLDTRPDYITLSGSGEPTLYSRAGDLIRQIKAMTDIPVAVLTNGSLLWRPEVRDELLAADLVIPSLDAADDAQFASINRPCSGMTFDQMLSGLVAFRQEFSGQYWLEVFLLADETGTEDEVARLARCAERIGPDRIQLNTVTRPPADDRAMGLSRERLHEFAGMFTPVAEVIADFQAVHAQRDFTASRDDVSDLLRRRPCSIDDIAGGLNMHRNEVVKYIEELKASGSLEEAWVDGIRYYHARCRD